MRRARSVDDWDSAWAGGPTMRTANGMLESRAGRRLAACVLLAGACLVTGCVQAGARERHQAARMSVVRGEPGDEHVRMAMWPATPEGRAVAWLGRERE